MWILLIVLMGHHSMSSEQMNFGTKEECLNTKLQIEKEFDGEWFSTKARCQCIEVDQ